MTEIREEPKILAFATVSGFLCASHYVASSEHFRHWLTFTPIIILAGIGIGWAT